MTLKSKRKKAKFVQKEESVINLVSAKQRVRRRNVPIKGSWAVELIPRGHLGMKNFVQSE